MNLLKKIIKYLKEEIERDRRFSAGASKELPTDPNIENPFTKDKPEQS